LAALSEPHDWRRTMNTRQISTESWKNARHWSWRSTLGVYFAKDDSRVLAPKATPALGWTLNLARPSGAALLLALVLLNGVLGAALAIAVSSI
jgi:uncharacterized membrane protein